MARTLSQPRSDCFSRYATEDAAGLSFDKLSLFCDKWGHRLQGSQVLEDSIDDHVRVLEEVRDCLCCTNDYPRCRSAAA